MSKLESAIESGSFNLVVAVVIFSNAITIGIETDSKDPSIAPMLEMVERIFLVFYIAELSLRFWVYRCKLIHDFWYLMDVL